MVCGAVYAELLAHPKVTVELVDRFLAKTEAEVDFDADESIWKLAGNRFSHYARRRRESAGSHPRRLLVDFVVGAHCLLRANRLVTLDAADYALAFPELRLMS